MSSTELICIDFQRDFTSPGGACYAPRSSVDFVKDVLVPFLRERGLKLHEIVSDYRQPRPGDPRDCCRPGDGGFESDIPPDMKDLNIWLKSMNSPAWVRENIGDPDREPGIPYPDPRGLSAWLESSIGSPGEAGPVVLFGLTLDRCVLCTAQELRFRGYNVRILAEGTDTASGSQEEKRYLLEHPPVTYWARPITWGELKGML
jgi:nicotinamidase-related amidase